MSAKEAYSVFGDFSSGIVESSDRNSTGKTLISVFEDHLGHLKFNKDLEHKLYIFKIRFINKNEDHMAFFGGNLTGCYEVKFTDREFDNFFNDILGASKDLLGKELLEVDAINKNFKISSDCFNLTCMYLIHGFLNSKYLDTKAKIRAATIAGELFNYRCITALLRVYFQHPIDVKMAEAVYAEFSKRFLIKELGNWQELMTYRAVALFENEKVLEELTLFKDDYGIVKIINALQGSMRSHMKNIYREFLNVKSSGGKINILSNTGIDLDGEEIIKDKVHGADSYIHYLMDILHDRSTFIKDELADIVAQVVHTVQKKHLILVLEWVSDNYISEDHKLIEELVKKVLIYSQHYLAEHRYVLNSSVDIANVVMKLRNNFISSRASEGELIELRDLGDQIVNKAILKINTQALASVRTAFFLYISLRAYTKHHYVN